ncbi:helix-turn-helix domain-containing protein [Rathayibacter oskolensis]|uniref:helix-turn-helix domain-containing protein n=1 Tax=Rathayibacter oskolensis TaxID=1891671 RepID=UPI003CC7DB1F
MRAGRVPLTLEPHPGAEVTARSRAAQLGGIHLLCTEGRGADVVRTPRQSRDGTPPSVMVSVLESGATRLEQDGTVADLRAGDIVLATTTRPYRIRFAPGTNRSTFQIPVSLLELPVGLVDSRVATVFRPTDPVVAAVSGFLRAAAQAATLTSAPLPDAPALERPTLAMVATLLTLPVAEEAVGRAARAQSLGIRILTHVQTRLADPDLSARTVAAALGVSERSVYAALARSGVGLGDRIREGRLALATRALADDPLASISAIAHECGFADHSHFTRVFRARYGITPSDWRRGAAGAPDDRAEGGTRTHTPLGTGT